MIRCSIWTLPFDKIRFSQLNTASAGIVPQCRFFSVRTEEMPEVIALDHVFIVLHFPAKLCILAFQSDVRSLLRTDLYSKSSCFKAAISSLSFAINLFAASRAFCSLDSFFSAVMYFFASVDRCHTPRQPWMRRE